MTRFHVIVKLVNMPMNKDHILIKTGCVGGRHNMPPLLQVDLWPFDLESGVRVTCDVAYLCHSVPILVFLGLYVLDLGPMYATDRRQTDIRDAHRRLMPPPCGGGGIIIIFTEMIHCIKLKVVERISR